MSFLSWSHFHLRHAQWFESKDAAMKRPQLEFKCCWWAFSSWTNQFLDCHLLLMSNRNYTISTTKLEILSTPISDNEALQNGLSCLFFSRYSPNNKVPFCLLFFGWIMRNCVKWLLVAFNGKLVDWDNLQFEAEEHFCWISKWDQFATESIRVPLHRQISQFV